MSRKVFESRFVILVGLQLAILVLGVAYWGWSQSRGSGGADVERLREVANELQAAGILGQAAQYYRRYLEKSTIGEEERSKIALSVAELYENQGNDWEAIPWLYEAKLAAPKSEWGVEASKRLVSALERMGKVAAAKQVMLRSTSLNKKDSKPKTGAVLAQVGKKRFYQQDLNEAYDALPKPLQKEFSSKEGRVKLLQKIVSDQILFDKAKRLALDKTPLYQKQRQMIEKQLLVEQVVAKELGGKITAAESDLRNYFKANQKRYPKKKFEQVKAQVEKEYRLEKTQAAYQKLIADSIKGDQVNLYPERIQ